MMLRFQRKDGTRVEFQLGERPVTIGRSPEADLVVADEKVSRLHCGIRQWDGDFILKDLRSRNGTFVNGRRVEVVRLAPGDQIRVGSCVFSLETEPGRGTETIFREIAEEMSDGKGYSTLMKEVVEDAAAPPAVAPSPPASGPVAPALEPAPETVIAPARRRVVKVRIAPKKPSR